MGSSCCGPKPDRTGDCCSGSAAEPSQSAQGDSLGGRLNPTQGEVDVNQGAMEQCNEDDKCDGE